ncbi:MAG: hypothetical protein AAGD05_13125, partial [Bacteroidota bacterium]
MKKISLLPILLFLFGFGTSQAQIVITNADLEQGISYTWTNNNEYLLDGIVFVKPGSILTIEAGTIIKGRSLPSSNDLNSMLIVTAGATINANGEENCPIIFTSEFDDLNNPNDLGPLDAGLWGGVAILGNAPVGDENAPVELEGFVGNPLTQYGGNASEESSGVFRYVSVRHSGGEVGPGNEVNAVTFAGVGSGTLVEYVEAYATFDDGIEFFGGTVNTRYLIATFCGDDAFDIDLGYRGKGQFWFGLGDNNNRSGIEWDGAKPDENPLYSKPTISNVTLITDGPGSESDGINMRDGAAGNLYNSIITGHSEAGWRIETQNVAHDVYAKLVNGEIIFANNIWNNFLVGNDPNDFLVIEGGTSAQLDVFTGLFNSNNNEVIDPLLTSICFDDLACINPLPQAGSPALSGALALSDPFFEVVNFRGAFGTDNWMENWSVLDLTPEGGECKGLTEGKITVQFDQNGNCTPEAGETGLDDWIIKVESPGLDFFVKTDNNGEYIGFLPSDATQATASAPNFLWNICEATLPLENLGSAGVTNAAFSAQATTECPLMVVDLSTPFLRRCFDNTYHVNYCNDGTALAEDVQVEIELDPFLDFISASIPHTVNSDGLYVFEVGEMSLGECGSFSITANLNCEATLGQTHCTSAEIFPDTVCVPILQAARLETTANCVNDEVRFIIHNNSNFNMNNPVP